MMRPSARDLQSVRPALIFDRDRPFAIGLDAEDAAEGNVDDVEIAILVERRSFDEGVRRHTRPVGIGPIRPLAFAAEPVGHCGEQLGFNQARRRFQVHHCYFCRC
ncbi:hypothetical protein ACVWYI_002882 [Bradyrhizobium sp. LB13.1]